MFQDVNELWMLNATQGGVNVKGCASKQWSTSSNHVDLPACRAVTWEMQASDNEEMHAKVWGDNTHLWRNKWAVDVHMSTMLSHDELSHKLQKSCLKLSESTFLNILTNFWKNVCVCVLKTSQMCSRVCVESVCNSRCGVWGVERQAWCNIWTPRCGLRFSQRNMFRLQINTRFISLLQLRHGYEQAWVSLFHGLVFCLSRFCTADDLRELCEIISEVELALRRLVEKCGENHKSVIVLPLRKRVMRVLCETCGCVYDIFILGWAVSLRVTVRKVVEADTHTHDRQWSWCRITSGGPGLIPAPSGSLQMNVASADMRGEEGGVWWVEGY